jgi:hypothetical protein
MVKSEYYRRQADLCLQLSLAQRDQRNAVWLIELAEEMLARAEKAAEALKSGLAARGRRPMVQDGSTAASL